MEVFRA
jgi:hypothetical protein